MKNLHDMCASLRTLLLSALSFLLVAGCGPQAGVKTRPLTIDESGRPVVKNVSLARGIEQGKAKDYLHSLTDTFSTQDNEIIAHVDYAGMAGAHAFSWHWYDPSGRLYVKSKLFEVTPPNGRYIDEGSAWHKISVRGDAAMSLPGQWRVDIYLDGSKAASRQFTLQQPYLDVTEAPKTRTIRRDAIAVVIGNKNYIRQGVPDVEFAHQDADLIKQYLIATMGFSEGNVILRKDISKTGFEELFGVAGNHRGQLFDYVKAGKSEVFVYYSGHGAPDPSTRKGYLVPVDSNPDRIILTGYDLDLLYENLARLPSTKNIVVLDTCFSGGSATGQMLIKNASPIAIHLRNPDLAGDKTVVMTSAQGDQISSWYNEKKLSLFTYFFLKALHGQADKNRDGILTIQEIFDYVSDKTEGVPYWARRLHGNRDQWPVLMGQTRDDYVLVNY